ncbi:MAG: flippase-like domain-containing protein [Flavobacteriales bacterium]|nr:flippase-like domain-containing protein [Flavobacteriales bacterium]
MKKTIISTLKVIIPLGLGIFLIWMVYKDLTPENISDINKSFHEINYVFLLLSVLFGIFSHLSRAWRWKYPLNHLGYKPKIYNSFFTTMIGYFANMGIPRSGEILRCGVMSKYENIPFTKLVGTVIAERVADLIILFLCIATVFFIQFDLLKNYFIELGLLDKFSPIKLLIIGITFLILIFIFYLIITKSNRSIFTKIRLFLSGIKEGIQSILMMPNRGWFLFHTIFIWLMYFLMFYITFFSLKDIQSVPMGGVFTAFVLGGVSIAATNGGIGAYPLAISSVLMLYGVEETTGYAFGWAIWTAQTIMIVVLGLISLLLVSKLNQSSVEDN